MVIGTGRITLFRNNEDYAALRGQPFGDESRVACTVSELGLEHTVRPEGRAAPDEDRGDRHLILAAPRIVIPNL